MNPHRRRRRGSSQARSAQQNYGGYVTPENFAQKYSRGRAALTLRRELSHTRERSEIETIINAILGSRTDIKPVINPAVGLLHHRQAKYIAKSTDVREASKMFHFLAKKFVEPVTVGISQPTIFGAQGNEIGPRYIAFPLSGEGSNTLMQEYVTICEAFDTDHRSNSRFHVSLLHSRDRLAIEDVNDDLRSAFSPDMTISLGRAVVASIPVKPNT